MRLEPGLPRLLSALYANTVVLVGHVLINAHRCDRTVASIYNTMMGAAQGKE